jgi:hypothetical protein
MNTYSKDDLVSIVTGANIAGYMEQRGEITVNDDEELTEFLTSQYELYRSEHSDEDWFEFIKNALLQHYCSDYCM